MFKKIHKTLTVPLTAIALAASLFTLSTTVQADPGITPEKGKAVIVFTRSSRMAFAIKTSIVEVVGDKFKMVGILKARTKIIQNVSPGKHLFMIVGESADYMTADVEAGKVYYANAIARMGAWKARFSLVPVNPGDIGTKKHKKYLKASRTVDGGGDDWMEKNMDSIQQKHQKYYEKWMSKPESSRPHINKEDGV